MTPAADETLDARTVDGPPFEPIVDAIEGLDEGETLLLINSFEPVPLYDELAERGLEYAAEEVDEGEWHVRISRTGSG